MGLLTKLLTFPVTGPVKGGWWVLDQIVAHAEAELYDERKITDEMRALAAQVEAGEISEQEHAAAEEALLERLVEARARRVAPEEM